MSTTTHGGAGARAAWRWRAAEAAVLAGAAAAKGVAVAQLAGHPLLPPAAGLDGRWNDYARPALAALGVLAVWLTMRTARGWFGDAAGLLAGVLLAAAGVVTFREILILPSALDPILMAAFVWTLARAARADAWGWWAGAGLAGGLLALNRPQASMVLAGVAAILAVRSAWRRSVEAWVAFASFALAAMIALAPLLLRAGWPATTWRLALDGLQAPPGDIARVVLRNLPLVAHRTELPFDDSYAYFVWDEPTLFRWLPIGAWCLVPLGVAGLFARPRSDAAAYRLWCAVVPLYGIGVALAAVSGRSRLPLLVPLAVTAAGAVSTVVAALRARRWGQAIAPIAVAAALAVAAFRPLALDDGRLEARVAMASVLAGQGRTAEAIARAAALDREHPHPGDVHYRIAVALQNRGDLAAAEAEVRRALQLDPGRPQAHATLGQLLAASGRTGEARHHLLQAATADAGATGAVRWILDDAIGGRDPSSAVFAVALLARTAALDAPALADLGHHLLEARRGDLAEPYYLALDARYPNRPDVLEALGIALLERGQPARAARTLQRAVELDPARPTAHVHLAIAWVQTDRLDDAESEARRALALQPGSTQARAVLDAVARAR